MCLSDKEWEEVIEKAHGWDKNRPKIFPIETEEKNKEKPTEKVKEKISER